MSTDDRIRDALTALAEAPGNPDEPAAWAHIQRAVDEDRRRRHGRRNRLVLAGLAAAGAAAAALVVVAGTDDDREAVDIGPVATDPAPTTGVPTTGVRTTGTSVPVTFPARPLAVVVDAGDGESRLDLYDADTGALVTRGLASSFHSLGDVSFGPDGTVYFTEELGDTTTVRAVPWDGRSDPTTPGDVGNDTYAGSLSPDGSTFAFIRHGVEFPQASVGLVDTATGDVRFLEWAPDEEDFFLTNGRLSGLEWSPDGERLLFVLSYEGDEVRVIDPAAVGLSESTDASLPASEAHWAGPATIVGLRSCCYPEFDEPRALQRVNLFGGDDGTVPPVGEVAAFDIGPDGSTALVRPDGTVDIVAPDGETRPLAIDGTVLDVGF